MITELQNRLNLTRPTKKSVWVFVIFTFLMGIATFFASVIASLFPWYFGITLGIASIAICISWSYPIVGLFIYFSAVLILPDWKLSDVLTVIYLCMYSLKVYFQRTALTYDSQIKLILTLSFLLIGWAVISIFIGRVIYANSIPYIYRDSRVFIYWLWVPVVVYLTSTNIIRSKYIPVLIISIACFISVIVMIQLLTGIQIVASGKVADLETTGNVLSGVTRVQISGLIFVTISLVAIIVFWAGGRMRATYVFSLAMLFLMALYANFGRAVWIWTAVALSCATFLLPFEKIKKLVPVLIIFLSSVLVGAAIFKPDALNTAYDRITSVSREGGKATSFGWRKLENQDSIEKIIESPLFGVGLGGEYRGWIAEIRNFEQHTRYVHNTWLFYSVKMGIPGTLLLISLVVSIWWRAFKFSKVQDSNDSKFFAITVAGTLPAFSALCFTQPELAESFGALYIAFIVGGLNNQQQLSKTGTPA